MTPQLQLLGNTALLYPLRPPDRSPKGIRYPTKYQDDATQWTVIAIGPGKRLPDGTTLLPEVRPGDRCLCNANAGTLYSFPTGAVLVNADRIEMVWT